MTAQPRWRFDGVAKVKGTAQFGADFPVNRLAYGAPILSTIAKGRIRRFDLRAARSVRGLIEIITPSNAMRPPNNGIHPEMKDAPAIAMLQDDRVYYALESAMDELAYRIGIDPLELRNRNDAEKDITNGKQYSQKLLRECYATGAERFGWRHRTHAPRSMRDGNLLLGWGTATATYPAYRAASSAVVRVSADGSAFVGSATHEIGTGTYTVLAQIAAESLGIDFDRVQVKTGDTDLPPAIYSGGSLTVATVGSAVHAAAERVKQHIVQLAIADPESPLHQSAAHEIEAPMAKCAQLKPALTIAMSLFSSATVDKKWKQPRSPNQTRRSMHTRRIPLALYSRRLLSIQSSLRFGFADS